MLPLYASTASRPVFTGTGNAGLWYDKFCDRWRADCTLASNDRESPKLSWIETVAGGKPLGDPGLLSESVARLHQLTVARGGLHGVFTTDGRFVTGLGRSHPVENGFAWHPTLGVPYLPGSSIKGLVRSWAERDAGLDASDPVIERLFGSTGAPHTAGRLVFLDAIPTTEVRLEADVMTPHYAGWTPDDAPGDWRAPIPVPFLVVAPRTPFYFSILPRAIEPSELDEAFGWLRDALCLAGAGAKSAVGYGRFSYDEPRTRALNDDMARKRAAREAEARRARLRGTPEGRWLELVEGKPEREVLELVRIHLEKQPLVDPAERRGLASAVAATPYLALWRRGEKQDKQRIMDSPGLLKRRAKLVDDARSDADRGPGRARS
jgi:CRISPR-associated protein Cmr6